MNEHDKWLSRSPLRKKADEVVEVGLAVFFVLALAILAVWGLPKVWDQVNRPYCNDPGADLHHCKVPNPE